MKSTRAKSNLLKMLWATCAVAFALLMLTGLLVAQQAPTKSASTPVIPPRMFDTPQHAVDAFVDAAEKYDVAAIEQIFGSEGKDLVITSEPARDKEIGAAFAAHAREKETVVVDPKTGNRAILSIGKQDWPFPVPMVKKSGKWFFDSAAGRQELLYRRIGSNELDAIQICLGYVEVQHEYALQKHDGSKVNQYAQRLISTPGKQDGLAWQNPDGTWGGPVGRNIALAIEKGYTAGQPFHGYYFKILKGQGPAAPLGEMDFVVNSVMIGGFALVAAPAEYRVTGVKTFMVSHTGVVYEKDLGPKTLDEFKKMERFNPDKTWSPVKDQ